LVRSPTPEKLAVFLDRLKDDPTALWYFLTIHRDSILHPLIRFLKWKNAIVEKRKRVSAHKRTVGGHSGHWRGQQQQLLKGHEQKHDVGLKRSASAALSIPVLFQPLALNSAAASFPNADGMSTKDTNHIQKDEAAVGGKEIPQPNVKRQRQFTEEIETSR
jgi:hypothetical protein